jgi:O-antigen/teichoic acid export membrane protein
MAREEPRKVALLSALAGLSQLGLSVVFVAGLHQGALGVLRANLVSSALVGVTSIVLMLRMSNFAWPLPRLGQALVFSLPLVPHLTANWALAISDRLVLDRYVPAADVGRYSLGYVFSLIVSLVAASIGNALGPAANRQLKDPLLAPNVPPLGTYSLVATVAFALGVAVTAPEILAIVAPASYAPASAVVPWVVLGAVFQGFYFVWSTGTWFSMKTKLVPLVTLASAALNVGLNLVFVPRYGVMAAAVSTAVSYAASAALHGLLAQHLHPIAWEYRRWALLLGVGAICYGAGMALPQPGVLASLAIKTVFVALAFPLGLIATGFLTRSEAAGARARLARGLRRV